MLSAQTCFCKYPWSVSTPAPMELAASGLFWPRFLVQSCFCKQPWSGSAPALMEFTVSGLFRHRLLSQSSSFGFHCLIHALTKLLAQSCSYGVHCLRLALALICLEKSIIFLGLVVWTGICGLLKFLGHSSKSSGFQSLP